MLPWLHGEGKGGETSNAALDTYHIITAGKEQQYYTSGSITFFTQDNNKALASTELLHLRRYY